MDFPDRVELLKTYYRHQNWSLPASIVYNMAKNPLTAKSYQRLVICCKYFFVQNPVIVVENLNCHGFIAYLKSDCRRIDFTKVSNKLWVTNALHTPVPEKNQNCISSILPQLYRIDATFLFFNNQNLTFNEFLFLASNVEDITLFSSVVIDECGSIVSLQKLVSVLPSVKKFALVERNETSSFNKDTASELLKIPCFLNIDCVEILCIPESFDIQTFFEYMKKNKHTKFRLYFSLSISDAYKNRLNAVVDEILEAKDHEYKVPFITFNELAIDKRMKLERFSEKL